jgi:hypothetical protein
MKISIFWDITPCSPLKVNRRFGRTYRLHLQDRSISQVRNQRHLCCGDSTSPDSIVDLLSDGLKVFKKTCNMQQNKL